MRLFGRKKQPEPDPRETKQRNAEDVPCTIEHIVRVLRGRIALYHWKLEKELPDGTEDYIPTEQAVELFDQDAGIGTDHIKAVLRKMELPSDELLGVLGYERWRPPQVLYIRKKVN